MVVVRPPRKPAERPPFRQAPVLGSPQRLTHLDRGG